MMKFLILVLIFFSISYADDSNVNIDKIVKSVKKSNSHVMVFLHKPNCGYCEKMIDFTLDDERIINKIKKDFIIVDIDVSDAGDVIFGGFEGSKREFAQFLGYDFYPSSIFIDKNGEVIYAQPGYQDEVRFLDILHYIDSYSYENIGIEDFKR